MCSIRALNLRGSELSRRPSTSIFQLLQPQINTNMRLLRSLVPSLVLLGAGIANAAASWSFEDAVISVNGKGASGNFKDKYVYYYLSSNTHCLQNDCSTYTKYILITKLLGSLPNNHFLNPSHWALPTRSKYFSRQPHPPNLPAHTKHSFSCKTLPPVSKLASPSPLKNLVKQKSTSLRKISPFSSSPAQNHSMQHSYLHLLALPNHTRAMFSIWKSSMIWAHPCLPMRSHWDMESNPLSSISSVQIHKADRRLSLSSSLGLS